MISFYGGKPGQDFYIAGIFPNKVAMDNDLAKKYNSEIPLNSFVMISYGDRNTTEYTNNLNADKEAYGHTYDSTLWYKIYNEADITTTDDLTRYGIHYELIAVLTGQVPIIGFVQKSEELSPTDAPFITVEDLSDVNFPKLKAHLPRAVNWYAGTKLTERTTGSITDNTVTYYKGDIYFNSYNGNVYKCTAKSNASHVSKWSFIGNILGPSLDIGNVTTKTVAPVNSAAVVITQGTNPDGSLLPGLDLDFSIPRGSRFFSGTGTYNSSGVLTSFSQSSSALNGDFFLEETTANKVGNIYYKQNNAWVYKTSIFGQSPQITANATKVNPDHALKVKVTYASGDTKYQHPTLTFDIPRGSKWFTQNSAPAISSTTLDGAANGDFWFNTADGNIYKCASGNWNTKVGTFIIDLTNVTTTALNPYKVTNGTAQAVNPSFKIAVDASNPALRPKVTASIPKAPMITIDSTVGVLDPSAKNGTATATYTAEGVKFKFNLPQGIQGEIGKGLNVRRSYDTIADRDANAEGLTWKDGEACTVRTSAGSEYYKIYIYQNDYPGKWVYSGTLLISSIDDTKTSPDYAWSSQKIDNELTTVKNSVTNLSTTVNQDIQDLSDSVSQQIQDLNDSVNQNLSQEITDLTTETNKVKTALTSPFTWGQLKNGKTLS